MTSKLWLATIWSYKHISWHLADLIYRSQSTFAYITHFWTQNKRKLSQEERRIGEFILQFHTKIYQNFLSSFQLDQDLRQINIFQIKSSIPPNSLHVGVLKLLFGVFVHFSFMENPLYDCLMQFTWSTDNVGGQVLGPPQINKQQLKKFEYKICKKLKGV